MLMSIAKLEQYSILLYVIVLLFFVPLYQRVRAVQLRGLLNNKLREKGIPKRASLTQDILCNKESKRAIEHHKFRKHNVVFEY